MRLVKRSFSREAYPCLREWPEDCALQCGGGDRAGYFFEAFPRAPDTFLRGEGASLAAAEEDAWREYVRQSTCPLDHADVASFEKKNYTNGLGFCRHCGLAIHVFPPWEDCRGCGEKTYYSQDRLGGWWCEKCRGKIPDDLLTETQKWLAQAVRELSLMSDEDLREGLTDLAREWAKHDGKDPTLTTDNPSSRKELET